MIPYLFLVETIYSPVNTTYNSNFLTLYVSFGWGAGLQCSLNYSIDGNYGGPVPLTFGNTTGFQLIGLATGLVQLPELSEGSHRLIIYEEAYLNDYHGANPPGAPFKPIAPGSADYYAAWADTVDFSINSSSVTPTPTPPGESAPPTITNLLIENKTYNIPDIPLNFIVNENTSKVAYSLDGKDNVTINGNITLTGLSVGAHNLTVYTWNDAGNIGASQTVNFAVANVTSIASQSSGPFPAALVIVSVVSVAVVIGGCLVYFKNRKH
ncbi:MAG TPA: hypothetical protein VJY36_03845 [Candidatus Bathyarchaeia archaeon]|nr:hypothetical protein [Candidatus Bathyarchaeia archaeon]